MAVSKHPGAYQVRVEREGEVHSKYFSWANHGGQRKTLAKARAHEAFLLATLPAARHRVVEPSTGSIVRTTVRTRTGESEVWKATIQVAPKRLASTKISIGKHGAARAMQLAKRWLKAKQVEQRRNYGWG